MPDPPAPPAVPAQPKPSTGGTGNGTYQVGADLPAGRYKTTGPDGSGAVDLCYWARLKDDSGAFDSIIANEIVSGPGSVTVNDGEFIKFSGGCRWTRQ